jgi:2-methylcitrate dehydratase PrpD
VTINGEVARFLLAGGAIPEPARHEAKRALLNAFAAALFARFDPASQTLLAWAQDRARAGRAAVLWDRARVEPHDAAIVNAAMMHVADFDDTHRPTYVHTAAAVAAALLAAAAGRPAGRDVSGSQFLDAYIRGVEVELMYAEALFPSHYLRGFHITATVGALGAAAACAVLEGLDEQQTLNALGFAAATASGLVEMLGTSGNAYQVGASARSGLVAVELAARGLDSVATAFDGERGMLHATSDEDPARASRVAATLGQHWRIRDVSYKALATETITQAPLEAVLAVRARIPAERRARLRRIELLAKPIVVDVVGQRARKFGAYPCTEMHARFDIRYCVAATWVAGRWTPAELSAATRADPIVRALHDGMTVLSHGRPDGNDVRLRFEFDDASVEEVHLDAFRGSAENPMTDDDLVGKLRDAAPADDDAWAEGVAVLPERLWVLDEADSLSPLLAALTGGNRNAA